MSGSTAAARRSVARRCSAASDNGRPAASSASATSLSDPLVELDLCIAERVAIARLVCSGEPLRRVEQLPDVGTAPEGEPVGSEDGQGGLLAAGDLRSVVASALVAQLALEPLPLGDEPSGSTAYRCASASGCWASSSRARLAGIPRREHRSL